MHNVVWGCAEILPLCRNLVTRAESYGRPSPPKIQGCHTDQQIQSWSKDRLQDSIVNKGMAWPNYGRFSFPS